MSRPRKYFAISDTHFGHTKCWSEFKRTDGTPLRPFKSDEEMNQHMIDCWNSVVSDNDVVYHLGDVVINRKWMHILYALKGIKRLVRGNHDIFPTRDYMEHFDEIYGVIPPNNHKKYPFIMSHCPLHPDQLYRWKGNVHGHLHANCVKSQVYVGKDDPRYFCVSVENVNYTPVEFDEIVERFK